MLTGSDRPRFRPGKNLALKVPPEQFEETVSFYGSVLGFQRVARYQPDVVFDYDGKLLWVDATEGLNRAELWLEVYTPDFRDAEEYLAARGIERREGIEPLPEGFRGFWIRNPAGTVHLVTGGD